MYTPLRWSSPLPVDCHGNRLRTHDLGLLRPLGHKRRGSHADQVAALEQERDLWAKVEEDGVDALDGCQLKPCRERHGDTPSISSVNTHGTILSH